MYRVGFVVHQGTWEERLVETVLRQPMSYTHVFVQLGEYIYDYSRDGYFMLHEDEVDWAGLGEVRWLHAPTLTDDEMSMYEAIVRAQALLYVGLRIRFRDLIRAAFGMKREGLFCTDLVHLIIFGYTTAIKRVVTPDELYEMLSTEWGWSNA